MPNGQQQWDQGRVALSKGMVYAFFGFPIGTGVDISSAIGTPLGQAHVAGGLNQIGMRWIPQASNGQVAFSFVTPQDVAGKTPAGQLMHLCYDHLHNVVAGVPSPHWLDIVNSIDAHESVHDLLLSRDLRRE